MLPHVSNTSQIGITSHTGHRVIADPARARRLPGGRPSTRMIPVVGRTSPGKRGQLRGDQSSDQAASRGAMASLNVQTGTGVVMYNKGDSAAPKGQS